MIHSPSHSAFSALPLQSETAHAYVTAVTALLAEQSPGLLKTLRVHDPDFVLLDGTLAECDRVGDGKADYSAKHKRHGGVNVQVVTDPVGQIMWLSPALPGRTHDLTAARTHKILQICARQASRSSPTWPTSVRATASLPPNAARPTANSLPPNGPQPGPVRSTGARRTRHRTAQVLANLPQIPHQPPPHVRHRQSCPHPGEARLKTLTEYAPPLGCMRPGSARQNRSQKRS